MTDHSKTSNPEFVLAADLGGTHLRFAIVDDEGRIYFRQIQPTPQAEKPDEIVHALIAAARECEGQLVELKGTISAVSVAVPGTVNVAQGLVVKVPNVPALDRFRLAAALESELGWPVRLENDANAAAIGEMWRGAGQGYNTIICVTLGTGVGGGIILEGKLWRGADGSAGEIGHIAIDPFAGVPCTCGSQGCLEVYASATAIVRMTREAKPRYPQSVLREAEDFTSAEVFAAGKEGDELALEVFHRMGMYLGIGLATLINLLNPQVIIIGGGLANGWELFEKPMHQQVVERAFPIPAKSVKILQAQCGDNAGLLGAARLAFDQQGEHLPS
ncbi:MAG TPA: ROK family protein [Pyrinomonadaceae bacterium]|nr:ROK family protein [Pyrinomonadaceae bacterium]